MLFVRFAMQPARFQILAVLLLGYGLVEVIAHSGTQPPLKVPHDIQHLTPSQVPRRVWKWGEYRSRLDGLVPPARPCVCLCLCVCVCMYVCVCACLYASSAPLPIGTTGTNTARA